VGRCDNSRRDGLVNDLSLAINFFTRGVEGFAHNSRRVIVEHAVAWLNEGPN
jgi:hypothetical protein